MAFPAQPNDSNSIPISSSYNQNDAFYAVQGESGGFTDASSNTSTAVVMSFLYPKIVQKAHAVTGVAGKTLTCNFTTNNIAGNSIIVSVAMGEVEGANITLTITDTLGNTYTEAIKASQSTTLESAIFLASPIAGGANGVTATIAGTSSTNTAIAMEIYEVWGPIALASDSVDQTATGTNAGSTSVATGSVTPLVPNEFAVAAIAAAGGTVSPGTNWTSDSGSLAPTGGNLGSFASESQLFSTIAPMSATASLSTSNAWAVCLATFKTVIVPVEGSVQLTNPLPAGTNVIGHVIVDSAGNVAITSLPSLPAGTNVIGHVIVDSGSVSLSAALPAGTNVIGHVITDSGSTTAVTQATASNLNAQVVGSVASGSSNAGNPVKEGAVFNTTQPTVTNGQIVDAQATAHGARIVATGVDTFNVTVNAALPAGSNAIGGVTQSGTWTVQPGNTANTTPWLVQDTVASSGGSIPYHNISAATTNFTNVKAAACQMYSYRLSNTSASPIYVKFYDKSTTPATTDTPKDTIQVLANSDILAAFPEGMKFSNGFGWSATGAVGDSDNTAIAANCVIDFSLNS